MDNPLSKVLKRLFSAQGGYQSNLNYQFSPDGKGGSDSDRKLAAISLPDLRGKSFLDLGCNAGFFCAFARDSGAVEVLGVDKSEKVIAVAKELNPDIRYLDTGWDIFPVGTFDVVICLSAIHYASNPIRLADDILAHLSDTGLFVLEGGLWGAEENLWSDTLLPVWREVGDKVRHLSRGYLTRHLLTKYAWTLKGRSINQGGDLLDRYVVHAIPGGTKQRRDHFQLCLLEYAKGLAISAPVIQATQPAYGYVKELGSMSEITPEKFGSLLSRDEILSRFADDIAFTVGEGSHIVTQPTVPDRVLNKVRASLEAKSVRLTW